MVQPSEYRRGVRDVVPVLLGNIPFALIAGAAAVQVGLDPLTALGMSVIIFAGASQLAAIDLIGREAPMAVVVLTAAVINLRMMMYSASIAPHFRDFGERAKALSSYLLTDPAYALSVTAYRERDADRLRYYLGTAIPIWVVWFVFTLVGALVGGRIPESWGLDFAVPLVFLGLLVPTLRDRPSVAAAVGGGGMAVVGAGLPLNLGLVVGAISGIGVGLLTEARS